MARSSPKSPTGEAEEPTKGRCGLSPQGGLGGLGFRVWGLEFRV